ncbi:uncharacterized protein JCM10292_006178 [Rhodotorula paludigena]|uniref:uncharacterized protein n=1 Tax=Rhodotorula paludigena TaxID=86838 RepID=UPI00317C3528
MAKRKDPADSDGDYVPDATSSPPRPVPTTPKKKAKARSASSPTTTKRKGAFKLFDLPGEIIDAVLGSPDLHIRDHLALAATCRALRSCYYRHPTPSGHSFSSPIWRALLAERPFRGEGNSAYYGNDDYSPTSDGTRRIVQHLWSREDRVASRWNVLLSRQANITSFFELRRTQRILRSSTTYRYLLHKLKQELPEARAELDELRRLLPDRAFDAEEDNTRVRMVRELRHCLHDAEAKRIKHLPSLLHDPSFQHLAKVLESHHPHLHELDSLMKMEEPEIKREPGVKREHYSDSEDSQPPHQGRRRRIHIKTEPAEDHSLGRVVLLSSRQQHNYQQRYAGGARY